MVDKCRIAAGCISGFIRAGFAMNLMIMEGFLPTMPMIILCGLAAICMACSIHSEHSTEATQNGRQLSAKESRGCCARAYIWAQIIVMNVCLVLTLFMYGLESHLTITFISIIVVCLILDIYCVSCSNFKYFCGSYLDSANDSDDAYGVAPGGVNAHSTYNNMQQPQFMGQ